MTRLVLLFLFAALAVPATAPARPAPESRQATPASINARGTDVAADFRARGGETAGVRAPAPIHASEPAPVESSAGPSWLGTLGIGLGLILLAGGLGVYAGRTVRPRRIGA
jgi:hypothetical protein